MSDELVWKRRTEGEDNWRARNAADNATYAILLSTIYGPTEIRAAIFRDGSPGDIDLGTDIYRSTIGVGSVAEAKDACQEHHHAACRAKRWSDYMRDNEPPVSDFSIEES